jgi:Mg-chelatase subunit ChlI
MRQIYPFSAIVGQERMKRALVLNAINSQIGGVLIRGERGTAKSTAARALAALLPPISVVEGDAFHSDPERPDLFSEEVRKAYESGEDLRVSQVPTPFVDLPVSATEDRVVGTLDIEKAIQRGERHFEPGVLAAANRGVLYVDEVNLLDDHVVDLLLDSAAMGVNVVEREGISYQHPARFVLVGSMNPEEGDLRPQLLDRFAHAVDVVGLTVAADRVEILRRRIDFEQNPDGFFAKYAAAEENEAERIVRARNLYPLVRYTDKDLYTIAALTASFKVDGHRADIVILRTARAQAAYDGRDQINDKDILLAAELALPHRMKKQPFQESVLNPDQLQNNMRQARAEAERNTPEESDEKEAEGSGTSDEKKAVRAMNQN